MVNFNEVARESLWGTVYIEVRNAILDGDFRPHDVLKIREIANQMGVSGTPVRDALLQLVMERVLVMPSKRVISVPMLSLEEFQEIRTLRIMLEGHGAELAAGMATKTDIKQLESLNHKAIQAYEGNNLKLRLKLNRDFHFYLYSIAKMPILVDVLDRLWLRMSPLLGMWNDDDATLEDFTNHHNKIIEALKSKDPVKAKQAISDDILLGGKKIEKKYLILSSEGPKRSS